MASFKDRLNTALELRDISPADLSAITGIGDGAISQYRNGKYQAAQRNLEKIAKALRVNIPWLMGADVPMDEHYTIATKPKGVRIPVLGRVAAGVPIEAIGEIIDYEEISQEMAATGDFFGLRIQGQSMEPKISEGDVVIVRKQDDCDTGDVAVVMINNCDATVKRIKKVDNSLMLVATNPAYDPMLFSPAEVKKLPVKIIGKVVELRAKF